MNIEVTRKEQNRKIGEQRIQAGLLPKRSEMASVVSPHMSGISDPVAMFSAMESARNVGSQNIKMSEKIKIYGGAFHVPRTCHTASKAASKKVEMSVSEMLMKGMFNPQASGNTLPADWQTLWDALRIDISIRKTATPTIRENFYNIVNMPNSSKTFDTTEFYPYAFEFQLNNGEGQSVNQGETRGGQSETSEHFIYATGFTRTLMSELYDNSYDPAKVSEGIAIAYNAKRDDLSVSPILGFSYAGVAGSQTPADSAGGNRQEKLFNTIENGIDHLARRSDPVTDRKIVASDLQILCEPEDARHIQRVVNGLTDTNIGGQDNPKILPPISSITSIVAYDGEVIPGRVKDITYTGVTRGKAYLVKKNRYMNVGIKRGLSVEADATPDVTTLAREKRSWYFVEGQQTTGIQYFVQELTLPAYTPEPS